MRYSALSRPVQFSYKYVIELIDHEQSILPNRWNNRTLRVIIYIIVAIQKNEVEFLWEH